MTIRRLWFTNERRKKSTRSWPNCAATSRHFKLNTKHKMKCEIKNRWTGSLIFEAEAISLKMAVEQAVKVSLHAADLRAANLSNANLRSADLRAADLSNAKNIGDFTMADGSKFSQYLKVVVPALLTAGGKTLESVLASGCWDCHSWKNCPMAIAFDIDSPDKGPPLLQARINEFVQLFDAKLIPKPTLQPQEEKP